MPFSDETLLTLLKNFPGALFVVDANAAVVYANASARAMAGVTHEKILGQPLWLCAPHLASLRLSLAIQEILQRHEPDQIEYLSPVTNCWFHVSLSSQEGYVLLLFQERLESLRLYQALNWHESRDPERMYSEDELRTLVDTIPHFVWMMSPDGSAEYGNQRWCDYTGLTLEQLQGDGWLQLIHLDDRPRVQRVWQASVLTGAPYEVDHRILQSSTGSYRWFLARGIPLRDHQGKIVRWLGTCTDIEDQKRVEEALRQSQSRINALMNSSLIGIFISEGEQVVEANETYLHMTGYTQEDLAAGRINWVHMTPPEYMAQTEQALEELASPPHVTRYEKDYLCKDGHRLPVVVGAVVLRLEPRQTVGFVLDNSARKELEQRKDDFIVMASHELRTPLTAIKGNLQLIEHCIRRLLADKQAALSPATIDGVEHMALIAQRALRQVDVEGRLLNDLLDATAILSNTLQVVLEPCDLRRIVDETVHDMQVIAREHRLIVECTEESEISVIADQIRIKQVIMNYIMNALKYSSDLQSVLVGISSTESEARVWVKDQGQGLTPEAQEKIWDRFSPIGDFGAYKNRGGGGLGLGLYISRAIILQHGGHVGVESRAGKGATFWFTLPLPGRQ